MTQTAHSTVILPRFRSALLILFVMGLLYFFSFFQRVAVPGTIFNELQRDFQATASAIATLGSIYLFLYGGLQIFVGLAADCWGGGRVLLTGAILLSLGAVVFPRATNLQELYIARALVGLGASAMYVCIAKELDSIFAQHLFAMMLSVSLFLGYAGGLCGTLPFEQLAGAMGWRPALSLVGWLSVGATLLAAVVFACARRLRNPVARAARSLYLGEVLANRPYFLVVFAGAINFMLYFIWQTVFGKKILLDTCAISSATAATILFAMMLCNMGMTVASGFVSRLMNNRRKPILVGCTALSLLAVMALLLGLALDGTSRFYLMAGSFLALGTASGTSVIFCCSMKELSHPQAAGTAIGLSNGAAYLTVALAVNGAGFLLDCFRHQAVLRDNTWIYPLAAYRLILLFSLGLAVCSLITALFTRETHGKSCYPGNQ